MSRRRGFTLVELLVVIAIIGVLISLLLPAIQAAREAARRTQCESNVKQLVLGLQNYHGAHGAFPPAHVESGVDGPSFRHQFGWLALMLPFVEEQNTYDLIDFAAVDPALSASQNPAFYAAGGTNVAVYICPSDPVNRVDPNWAPANYVANQGPLCECRGPSCTGMFGHGTAVRISQVTDGTAKTIAVGETLKGDLNPNTLPDNYIATSSANASDIASCQSFPPNASDRSTVWLGGHPHQNMFSTARPPNDASVDCRAPNNGCTNFAARGNHASGVNVGFVDGSVHFLSNTIGVTVIQALGTRNQGEIVPAGIY